MVMLEGKDCWIGCGVKGGYGFKGNIMVRVSGDIGRYCVVVIMMFWEKKKILDN